MINIESRQTIIEYREVKDSYGIDNDYAIDDFMAIKEDIINLITLINNTNSTFTPQFGTGSPEGIVTSNYNRTYYDNTLSPASATMYVNETVGSKIGWVIIT